MMTFKHWFNWILLSGNACYWASCNILVFHRSFSLSKNMTWFVTPSNNHEVIHCLVENHCEQLAISGWSRRVCSLNLVSTKLWLNQAVCFSSFLLHGIALSLLCSKDKLTLTSKKLPQLVIYILLWFIFYVFCICYLVWYFCLWGFFVGMMPCCVVMATP